MSKKSAMKFGIIKGSKVNINKVLSVFNLFLKWVVAPGIFISLFQESGLENYKYFVQAANVSLFEAITQILKFFAICAIFKVAQFRVSKYLVSKNRSILATLGGLALLPVFVFFGMSAIAAINGINIISFAYHSNNFMFILHSFLLLIMVYFEFYLDRKLGNLDYEAKRVNANLWVNKISTKLKNKYFLKNN